MISVKISKFIKAFPSSVYEARNPDCLILNQKETCEWDSLDIPNSSVTFSFKPFFIKLEQYLLYVPVEAAPVNGWAVEGSNDRINFDIIQEKEAPMCTKMSGILCSEGNDRIETVSTSKSYRYIRIRATKKGRLKALSDITVFLFLMLNLMVKLHEFCAADANHAENQIHLFR